MIALVTMSPGDGSAVPQPAASSKPAENDMDMCRGRITTAETVIVEGKVLPVGKTASA